MSAVRLLQGPSKVDRVLRPRCVPCYKRAMTQENPNTMADRQALALRVEQAGPILAALDAHLHLTNDQVERLLFRTGLTATGRPRRARGSAYAANTALRRLREAGLVSREPVFLPARTHAGVHPGAVNVLTPAGARAVGSGRWRRHLLPRPWQPILHDYWIREAFTSLALAAQRDGLTATGWRDDRQLLAENRVQAEPWDVIPDGRLLIGEPSAGREGAYLLEIDLDTVVLRSATPGRRDWTRKVRLYAGQSTRSLRQRFGGQLPVIVLTATTTQARLDNLIEATTDAGGAGRFWFTTLAELIPTPLPGSQLAGLPVDEAESHIAAHERTPLGPIWRTGRDQERRGIAPRHLQNPI